MVVEESREGFEVSGLESEGPEIEITAEVGEDVDDEERIEDDEPMEIGYRLDPEECGQVFTEFREAARAVKNLEVEYRETAPPVPPMENPSEYVAYMPEDASKRATEYEIDIEDIIFVKKINAVREEAKLDPMSYGKFELLMDRFEKSSYFKKLGVRKEEDPDAVCCVCMDGETDDQNQIIFCDLCNIPVHQDCYGVPYVPAGEWFCRRCTLSPSIRVKCIMCGQRGGAMKQTSDSQWVHVICAIWINETCFGNPVFMEPVQNADKAIELRKNLKCVVCRERMGACIQCSFGTCARAFHVFCGVRANFEMTTQEIDNNSDVVIRKALCPEHCSDQDVREKTKKMLLRKKGLNFDLKLEEDEVCSISEADILPERIQDISRDLDVPWIEHFVGYWRFKREQKLGMPLLRSLQKAMKKMMGHKVEDLESEEEEKESEDSAIEEDMESKPEIEETEETQMMEVKKEEMMEDEIMKDLIKIRREKIKEESEEEETEEETDEEPRI
ncbi:hypothetical protein L596_011868 [Steinernema carpocapsae]|uniref:PHD-type domain-containing protein n=1 Tax=Steinernema carpocapsae TaxID=34508 RepID=A0A4U5NVB2_STECR|nr:hypothetical protein L596_011868 [Steinernema carpocapsae]